ncbi:MAG: methyltransferase domain-containing protein [Anaerolineae bacterium]|nr:methyltransferase domain-containing protein [Anaerolineae bacterium]
MLQRNPDMPKKNHSPTGWDAVADWYHGWVGEHGSDHHRKLAIPAILDLLQLKPGEKLLDIGCGSGVLSTYVQQYQADYIGVDVSQRLIAIARKQHQGQFIVADARRLKSHSSIEPAAYDACAFLLSIQDMNPLADVIHSATYALRPGGRVALLMTHPCFRIPRLSGWGYDEGRKLQFRRVDRYLTPQCVPMKSYGRKQSGKTISFHRPLSEYVTALSEAGLVIDALREITTYKQDNDKARRLADQEIPLFLGLGARKLGS